MSNPSESQEKMADRIESGEFFRESLNAYDISYHDPMTERYFFIGLTIVSLLIFILSITAILMIHPLSKEVPFIYTSEDIVNEYPKMQPLGERDETPNYVLKRFLTTNYLRLREEYSVGTVDRNIQGVRSQSAADVFASYEASLNPRNPDSPIALFQRNAIRRVEPVSYQLTTQGEAERMVIQYKERVIAGTDVSTRNKRAIITFRFEHIEVDQQTGEASKLGFQVLSYETETLNS